MSLSDEERKRLEELEQELYAEDPELAQELQSGSVPHVITAHTLLGTLTSLLGVLVLLLGIAAKIPLIGVLGFLLMGAGVYWITVKRRRRPR